MIQKTIKLSIAIILIAVGVLMIVMGATVNLKENDSIYIENEYSQIFSIGRFSNSRLITPYPNADLDLLNQELKTKFPSEYVGFTFAENILSSEVLATDCQTDAKVYLSSDLLIENNDVLKSWKSDYPLTRNIERGYLPILVGGTSLGSLEVDSVVKLTIYSDINNEKTTINAVVAGHIKYLKLLPEYGKRTRETLLAMNDAFIIMPDPKTLNAYFQNGRKDIFLIWKTNPGDDINDIYSSYGTDIKQDFANDALITTYPTYYNKFYSIALISCGTLSALTAIIIFTSFIIVLTKKNKKKEEIKYEKI